MQVHPIESESMRILRDRYDLSGFSPLAQEVVARVVHATADPSFLETMILDDQSVSAGIAALRAGAAVVTDVEMVRAGIAGGGACCYVREARADPTAGRTRSAAGIAEAARRHPSGAVLAVGCAPTALEAAVDLAEGGAWRPAIVVGVPVGFVGAAESKEAARRLPAIGIPVITNMGERGGSGVAAAIVNALARLAADPAGGAGGL